LAGEFRLTVIASALVLYGAIRWAHPFLIGGFE
jgi:hypothetical protein